MEQSCSKCGSDLAIDATYECAIPKHLAETNNPPSASERPGIDNLLSEAQAALNAVDERLNLLQQRRSSIQRSIDVCRGVLSPVRHLPGEILTEIFTIAGPVKATLGGSFRPDHDFWRTSRVCRMWHGASISCTFWSHILVICDRINGTVHPEILRTVLGYNVQLGRPVILDLQLGNPSERAERLLDVAIEFSEFWRRLSLTSRSGSDPCGLFPRLQRVTSHISHLESLTLKETGRPQPQDWDFGDAFQVAPALRHVMLSQVTDPSIMKLPWSQITHFHCTEPEDVLDFNLCLRLLRQMPNITSFKEWHSFIVPTGSAPSLHLEKLRILRVPFDIPLFDHLILPELQEIDFRSDQLNRVLSLIRRSSCTITRISLDDIPDDVTFNSLVQHTPSIRELVIRGFDLLGFGPGRVQMQIQSRTLPQLEELSFPIRMMRNHLPAVQSLFRTIIEEHDLQSFRVAFIGDAEEHRSRVNFSRLLDEFGDSKLKLEIRENWYHGWHDEMY